jgi:signal transduction histidine kinase
LQAESLKEDLAGTDSARLIDRLVSDTQRLTLQLENSLYLAEDGGLRMYRETKDFADFIEVLRPQWPSLKIEVNGKALVDADVRALECIVRNLLQNALLHGQASQVLFDITNGHNAKINLRVSDNGKGVSIPRGTLGKLFGRHYPGSGNGIGLYLIGRLTERMGGKLSFPETKEGHGFCVELELPGKLA